MYIFNVTPVAKPRMTQSDRWKERRVVSKYRSYCDELNLKARIQKFHLSNELEILFYLPMPKSWSRKKREEKNGFPHDEKPDIDNLIKGFIDAFKEEDKTIYSVRAIKYWGEEGRIEVI